MTKTIKLCNGFKVYEEDRLVLVSNDWQEVRKYFGIDVHSLLWERCTDAMFCFGEFELAYHSGRADETLYSVEAIPCND